jgi:hypothetical protein
MVIAFWVHLERNRTHASNFVISSLHVTIARRTDTLRDFPPL